MREWNAFADFTDEQEQQRAVGGMLYAIDMSTVWQNSYSTRRMPEDGVGQPLPVTRSVPNIGSMQ